MVVRVNGSTGIITVSGTSGAPSLRGPDGNSGISFDGDQVIISSSGLAIATITDSVSTITNLAIDTTTFEFSPGSSGTPTIAPSGDLNTGIYFPAADTIGFAEGGNEAARIDDSGRVLIGTTGVLDTGTGDEVHIATPVGSNVLLGRDDSVITDQNNLGMLRGFGNHGGSYRESTRIQFEADGSHNSTSAPGAIVFGVTPSGSTSPGDQMRLASNGDLQVNSGFGSVTPIYGVRGWARVDGDGAFSVYGSNGFDVITDQGTGLYRFNFENPMPDTNYSVAGSTDANTIFQVTNITATAWVQTNIQTTSATATDSDNTSIMVVR